MATSTCPRCWGTSFEMVQHTPGNSGFTFIFVQCAHCGTVVGTIDVYIAKLGILTASLIAGTVGWAILRGQALCVPEDEAERA